MANNSLQAYDNARLTSLAYRSPNISQAMVDQRVPGYTLISQTYNLFDGSQIIVCPSSDKLGLCAA